MLIICLIVAAVVIVIITTSGNVKIDEFRREFSEDNEEK